MRQQSVQYRVMLLRTYIYHMEKISRNLRDKKKKEKLPVISPNKSKVHLSSKIQDLGSSSTLYLKGLHKLYNQYKSNANILSNSPYYTNRQHQLNIASYLESQRNQPSVQQLKEIQTRFTLDAETSSKMSQKLPQKVFIRLHSFAIVLELRVMARTVGQLEVLLKKEFALQEVKSYGMMKRAESIGGFSPNRNNPKLDFLLSLKDQTLPEGKYELQPWFYEDFSGTVAIKDFKMIRLLGSGGFSLVYLARDKLKGNFHALKLIDKGFILDSQREMIVENERYVLGLLNSPFITPLRFCFETKNHFAFAIEYCPGGELFYQLKKVRRMTEDQARFYFLEILMGLDHIHKLGVIYRDLKPQNLLIGSDGHIRIADFGLAKPLLGRSEAHSFCGSPEYMAPEMLLKSGHKITLDYYCLGALLYQLVIGVPPFYSLDHDQIYKDVLNEGVTFPSQYNLSSQIKSILEGLLEKNPNKRLGSMHGVKQIMIHPWVGRITRKDIQDKKMKPPFLPDLSHFNFDDTQPDDRTKTISQKIDEDMKCRSFVSHFNQQFYFADPSFLPTVTKKPKIIRSHLMKSLEKGRSSVSSVRRVASDRLKSK